MIISDTPEVAMRVLSVQFGIMFACISPVDLCRLCRLLVVCVYVFSLHFSANIDKTKKCRHPQHYSVISDTPEVIMLVLLV